MWEPEQEVDYAASIEQARDYLRKAMEEMDGGLYYPAMSEAEECVQILNEVCDVIPQEHLADLRNEAMVLGHIAGACRYMRDPKVPFPRYFLACRHAMQALHVAQALPDGYRGMHDEKGVYVSIATGMASDAKNRMGVHEERDRDVDERTGSIIGMGGKTLNEWHEIVDTLVAYDMATWKEKSPGRIRRLREKLKGFGLTE